MLIISSKTFQEYVFIKDGSKSKSKAATMKREKPEAYEKVWR